MSVSPVTSSVDVVAVNSNPSLPPLPPVGNNGNTSNEQALSQALAAYEVALKNAANDREDPFALSALQAAAANLSGALKACQGGTPEEQKYAAAVLADIAVCPALQAAVTASETGTTAQLQAALETFDNNPSDWSGSVNSAAAVFAAINSFNFNQ